MPNQYQLDLNTFSLQKFKDILQTKDLIPSRVSLKEDLQQRFEVLEARGIVTMKDLIDALKTKQKISQFARETGLPVDYLTLLKREASSYLPSPVRLDKFPGVPAAPLERLASLGIKNTRQLFDRAQTAEQRAQICREANISFDDLTELVCLCDLSRAYGVGPVFARLIYDVGIRSIKALIGHSAEEIIQIYEEQTGKKADFGANEIQFSLELARELDIAVEI
ncbi:MAG: DUF4332 domain-containing protein [Anaerolineaceae bacterium]|nr:DUF4332 domain-containing protein [Anaerolineaceae bacterium]